MDLGDLEGGKNKAFETLVSLTMEDCNNLVNRLDALKFVDWTIFSEVWRDMKFSLIFWRPTWDEVIEFTELLFFVVRCLVLPPNTLSRRLCSLYLMYGVYIKQPSQDHCKFKVTDEDWKHLIELVQFSAKEDLKEHVYMFKKLVDLDAFAFCVSPIDIVSDKHLKLVSKENREEVELPEVMKVDVAKELEDLLESDLFQQVEKTEKAYNSNTAITFQGELASVKDLTSHLRKICISRSSKDFEDMQQRQKAATLAELEDQLHSPPQSSKSSKSRYSSSLSLASSVPTEGAIAMPRVPSGFTGRKPRGFAITSKNKTPAELKVLLPPEGYENIHSKNSRTLYKKTIPKPQKETKKESPRKKKRSVSSAASSSINDTTPSQSTAGMVSEATTSTGLSMPLL